MLLYTTNISVLAWCFSCNPVPFGRSMPALSKETRTICIDIDHILNTTLKPLLSVRPFLHFWSPCSSSSPLFHTQMSMQKWGRNTTGNEQHIYISELAGWVYMQRFTLQAFEAYALLMLDETKAKAQALTLSSSVVVVYPSEDDIILLQTNKQVYDTVGYMHLLLRVHIVILWS